MKKRRWPWIAGVTVVVAAVVGGFIFTNLNQVTQYETFEVTKAEVIKTVSANGQLAESQLLAYGPSEEPVQVSANGSAAIPVQFGLSLEIEAIEVSAGDEVTADDVLFSYLNQMGQSVEVVAITDGLVRSVDTAEGLRTSGAVLTIGSAEPVVSVFVSEYDADLVTLGQKATIELDISWMVSAEIWPVATSASTACCALLRLPFSPAAAAAILRIFSAVTPA